MNQKISVFAEKSSSRLNYILNFISQLWEVEIEVCHDETKFIENLNPKINYSVQSLGGFQIIPLDLLFQQNIEKFDFSSLENDDFAMIFFLLSRYEEYVINEKDQHGRFLAESSYLFKTNRLNQPWVDVLMNKLKENLSHLYPELNLKKQEFQTQLTLDIDQVFMYQNKSLKRWIGGNLRDLSQMKLKNFQTRNLAYFGINHDPWDVFDMLKERLQLFENQPILFFQVGNYGLFDKNLNFRNKAFVQVIKQASNWAKIGLHPSYQSNENIKLLAEEKLRLEKILEKPVQLSRQHFIKLDIPKTYQNLIKTDILNDYSMGFANQIGFRAGTSHAFFWYDLIHEKQTKLKIHPFCAMDVSLKNYLKLNPQQASERLKELYLNIQKNAGNFCLICHNESLSNHGEWENWAEMFFTFFEQNFSIINQSD